MDGSIEREFINFAYHQTNFSNVILKSFDDALKEMKFKNKASVRATFLKNQKVMMSAIKGSSEVWPPNYYAGKAWIDLVIEEGYLREDILPLFYDMKQKINSFVGHDVGQVILFKIKNKFYIRDGHKRIALARYFAAMQGLPAYLTGVTVINLESVNQEREEHV